MSQSTSRKQHQQAKAQADQQRCTEWLLPYLAAGKPRFLTKDELRATAKAELGVSKNSFDFAWINAIEETGREDWYEPLRIRRKTIN